MSLNSHLPPRVTTIVTHTCQIHLGALESIRYVLPLMPGVSAGRRRVSPPTQAVAGSSEAIALVTSEPAVWPPPSKDSMSCCRKSAGSGPGMRGSAADNIYEQLPRCSTKSYPFILLPKKCRHVVVPVFDRTSDGISSKFDMLVPDDKWSWAPFNIFIRYFDMLSWSAHSNRLPIFLLAFLLFAHRLVHTPYIFWGCLPWGTSLKSIFSFST